MLRKLMALLLGAGVMASATAEPEGLKRREVVDLKKVQEEGPGQGRSPPARGRQQRLAIPKNPERDPDLRGRGRLEGVVPQLRPSG
jgi:hypothetical protein